MNSLYNKVVTGVIGVIIVLFGVGFFIGSKNDFSENENRYLEQMPKLSFSSLTSGKYMDSLSGYLSDHFPFRDSFMGFKSRVDLLSGKDEINNVFIGKDGYLMERYQKGVNTKRIVNVLNQFYRDLNYVNMSLMLVPTSVTVNEERLPARAVTYSQIDEIKKYYDGVVFNTIDVTQALMDANDRYQMYYKLDHHWTSYGAYYAYVEYCQDNEIEPLSILDFDIQEVSSNFHGTLYSKTNLYHLPDDSIYLFIPKQNHYEVNYVSTNRVTDTLYEKKYLNQKDQYSMFLDNNHPLIVVHNLDVTNGKEIVVIKDSYANSFIPFLIHHYEKVHVIDPRFYKLSVKNYILENNNIRDVLFLYNMNTIDQDTGIVTLN